MTGIDLLCKHSKSVPVIFEPPCTLNVVLVWLVAREEWRKVICRLM